MPTFASLTCRTDKAIRPTKPLEIIDAGFLCGEPFVELLQSSWIVYSTYWRGVIIDHKLTITLRQRNGYPLNYNITISAGVAVIPANGSDPKDVLIAADAALYQAKNAGRDQVMTAQISIR